MSTTEYQDKMIICMSKADPRLNSVDIYREMSTHYCFKASSTTVQRHIYAAGVHNSRPVEKPIIYLKNRKARIEFAKIHIGSTTNKWRKVIFSDEATFLMFRSDGIKYVRGPDVQRFHHRYQLPTVKHGGGIVVFFGYFMLEKIARFIT